MELMQMLRLNLRFFSQDDTGGSNNDSVDNTEDKDNKSEKNKKHDDQK